MNNKRHLLIKHTDKSLMFRLRLFLTISLILLGIIIYDLIVGKITFSLAVLGIGVGIIIGLIAGRMFKIHWHEDKKKVVSKLDVLGIGILILYIFFEIFRGKIFGVLLQDSQTWTFTFAFFSGTMFGRFLTMGFNIRSILYSRGILKGTQ